jgi:SlyX protein
MSDQAHEVENRLTELEIKVTYTEDLLEQLDLVVIRQQQQIDALIRELADLRQPAVESGSGTRNLQDDMPPHF